MNPSCSSSNAPWKRRNCSNDCISFCLAANADLGQVCSKGLLNLHTSNSGHNPMFLLECRLIRRSWKQCCLHRGAQYWWLGGPTRESERRCWRSMWTSSGRRCSLRAATARATKPGLIMRISARCQALERFRVDCWAASLACLPNVCTRCVTSVLCHDCLRKPHTMVWVPSFGTCTVYSEEIQCKHEGRSSAINMSRWAVQGVSGSISNVDRIWC